MVVVVVDVVVVGGGVVVVVEVVVVDVVVVGGGVVVVVVEVVVVEVVVSAIANVLFIMGSISKKIIQAKFTPSCPMSIPLIFLEQHLSTALTYFTTHFHVGVKKLHFLNFIINWGHNNHNLLGCNDFFDDHSHLFIRCGSEVLQK